MERYALAKERVCEIKEEKAVTESRSLDFLPENSCFS